MGVTGVPSPSTGPRASRACAEEALRCAVALALGESAALRRASDLRETGSRLGWQSILAAVARERCLGQSWVRSGSLLRATADAEAIAAWRRGVTCLDEVGRSQLEALSLALDVLRAADVHVIVLKGAALSQRGYGAPFLRDSSDLDLFIPARQRVRAHTALRENGWCHFDGVAPDEATYVCARGAERAFIEVHSSLMDDPLVSHVQLPEPDVTPINIEGRTIPAHGGPSLAPYLAVHLAKHTSAPLAWIVDFDAVWRALDSADQQRSRLVARRAGAEGYLDLAIARAEAMREAAGGNRRALRKCGGASGLFRERHAALVGALAAPTPIAGARILGRWLARRVATLGSPSPTAPAGRLALLDSAVRPWRRSASARAASSVTGTMPERVVQLDIDTSLDVVRAVLDAGFPVWLVARGGSMAPTIPSGAQVLVMPRAAAAALHEGDVVLAAPVRGTPVIHRVHRVAGGHLVLRGDAMEVDDAPINASSVVGVVTHRRDHGKAKALGRRRPRRWRFVVRRLLQPRMSS